MASTAGKVKERRLERMRLGQAVCDFVALPSDPEMRHAIVPLTEGEYLQVLNAVNEINLPDDLAAVAIKDRTQAQWILSYAIREADDLTKRVYVDDESITGVEKLLDDLGVEDIDVLIDRYNEMVDTTSPRADQIPTKELNEAKKVLQEINWNELSGPAWFALKRFLFRVGPQLQQARLLGFGSTDSSTTKNDEPKSTPTA